MILWGALTSLRAEKTPFEPDLGHASVGKYKTRLRTSNMRYLAASFLVLIR